MRSVRTGDLRHRVTIQQLVSSFDEYNAPVETWQDVATVWAAVEPLSGREYFAAEQVQARVTTRITIRYRAGIEPTMRVLWSGKTYNIRAVIDTEGRHEELQLMCEEAA